MSRNVLVLGLMGFFALAMAMLPSNVAGVALEAGRFDAGDSPYVKAVNCSVRSFKHKFYGGGGASYSTSGICQVTMVDDEIRMVPYDLEGSWDPPSHATEEGKIYRLSDIAPDLFPPFAPYTLFEAGLICDADPWLNLTRCALQHIGSGFQGPDKLIRLLPRITLWPFPLTKDAIDATTRAHLLAEYKRATGQFVGPPISPTLPKSVRGFASTQKPPPIPSPPIYGAIYAPPLTLTSLTRGQTTTVQVKVTNTGTFTWTPSGPNPFNLSYHWYRANTVPQGTAPAGAVVWDGPRFLVPQTVATNQPVTIAARVTAPSTPGTFVLKWDMAHEGVAWFSGKGVLTGDQTVTVK